MLTDEELKDALDGWLLEFDRDPADREECDKFVAIIREAERGKGKARCPICGAVIPPQGHLCGGRADYGAAGGTGGKMGPSNATFPSQAYADKVLEVAVKLAVARMGQFGVEPDQPMQRNYATKYIDRAVALIQAANDAAMKREGEKS